MSELPIFSTQHYNAIAKEIREIFPITQYPDDRGREEFLAYGRTWLMDLALNLAKRFKKDNPRFDPLKFLDACSPNSELYPLSELWKD